MFRYAYGGFGPHAGFRHRGHWRGAESRPHVCFSRHSGPGLGVRRPIRYLAYKLDLDEAQVRELATILDRLKTARAQGDVDDRRTTADLAGAMEAAEFDEAGARAALDERGRSAEQLRAETLATLRQLHRLLDPEQRRELAYLIRSGSVSF